MPALHPAPARGPSLLWLVGTIPAAGPHASLVLQRWKCLCKTCASRRRSEAVCQSKCTRGKDTDVVKYYNFVSAHCDKTVMSLATQKATIEKTQSLFIDHGKEKFQDMLEPLKFAPAPPSPKRATCKTDVNKCVDFSFGRNEGQSSLLATLVVGHRSASRSQLPC